MEIRVWFSDNQPEEGKAGTEPLSHFTPRNELNYDKRIVFNKSCVKFCARNFGGDGEQSNGQNPTNNSITIRMSTLD